jgi:hypothetical protein
MNQHESMNEMHNMIGVTILFCENRRERMVPEEEEKTLRTKRKAYESSGNGRACE